MTSALKTQWVGSGTASTVKSFGAVQSVEEKICFVRYVVPRGVFITSISLRDKRTPETMNPFGHHGGHQHHHHGQEEEDERNRYRPPGYQPPLPTPPYYGGPAYPPAVQHVSHESGPGYGLPAVQHVSHEGGPGYGPPPPVYPPPPGYHGEGSYGGSHHHRGPSPPPTYPPAPGPGDHHDGGYGHQHHRHFLPHFPGVHHVSHERWEGEAAAAWHGQPTVRIYTKAENNFSLSIRDGKVILARNDPTDPYQASKFA